MELIRKFVTNNMHYKNNRIINVRSLVLHSIGCSQPNPDVLVRLWDNNYEYLAQIVIGTEKAYEVLPCMQTKGKAVLCWHTGDINGYSIGAEMTEPDTIKYTGVAANYIDLDPVRTKAHVLVTYKNAVDIFAQLCKFHGLNPLADGVILSHSECHRRGLGTNHADVEHLWDKFGLTMDQFRKDVNTAMGNISDDKADNKSEPAKTTIKKGDIVRIVPKAIYYGSKIAVPEWVRNQDWIVHEVSGNRIIINHNSEGQYAINSAIDAKYLTVVKSSFEPFIVSVNINDLNMRTGPDASYPRIDYIPRGAYTIVEVNGEWGRLKAKQDYKGKAVDAWIHLGYTRRI